MTRVSTLHEYGGDLNRLPKLPGGWRWATIGEVTQNFDGKRVPIKAGDREARSGQYPYYGASGVIDDIDDFLFDGEFLLIAEDGANLLSRNTPIAFRAWGKFWVNNHAHVVQTVEGMPLQYLEWYLNGTNLQFFITGSAQPKLNQLNLNRIPVPVAPLPEQRRIVSKIEELFSDLDAGVSALERAKANLKRYRASVLKAAVEGRLTADWRAANPDIEPASQLLNRILTNRRQTWEANQLAEYERKGKKPPAGWKSKYSEPTKPETHLLTQIPESWTWATVEQCSSLESNAITDGPFGSNLKTEHYTDSGPQVIRLNNIGEGEFKEAQAHVSFEHFETLTKHSVNADDVVIAMLGETLPRACLVPEHILPAIVKADCARFSTCRDLLLPKYAIYVLNSFPTRQRVSTLITGVGRPRINLGKTRSIPIPLPALDEQREIVMQVERLFSAIDHSEEVITINLQRASRLRQGILKRAFEGKLVSQAANRSTADVHEFVGKTK